MGIGRFAFTPILPMMQAGQELGVGDGAWLAASNYVGYLVGGLTAVFLRTTAGSAIRLGLAATAAATLAMGLTSRFEAWMTLRAAAGIASAWVLVFTSSWCLETLQRSAPPASRAMLGARVFAGVGVGIAIAGLLCGFLLGIGAGSRAAWTVLGAAAAIATLSIWSRLGSARLDARLPADPESVRTKDAVRMIACYGAFGFGYIIPATFLSSMAREAVANPLIYGASWPLFGLAAAASTLGVATIGGRLTPRTTWIAGHVVMAAGVACPLVLPGFGGIVASALLVGGTFMVVTMAGLQEARRVAGIGARRLIAAMTSSFAAGQIAGPIAVSLLASFGHGFAPALLLAATVLLASGVALLPESKRRGTT
jgi:MFS family permease